MVQYVVQVLVDADRMLNETYQDDKWFEDGKKKWKQLKGWNGKSPLYGAGKAYATRLVFDLAKAQAYAKREDAEYYARRILDSYCGVIDDYPVVDAKILKIEMRPVIVDTIAIDPSWFKRNPRIYER
jgi:hypothetical protein